MSSAIRRRCLSVVAISSLLFGVTSLSSVAYASEDSAPPGDAQSTMSEAPPSEELIPVEEVLEGAPPAEEIVEDVDDEVVEEVVPVEEEAVEEEAVEDVVEELPPTNTEDLNDSRAPPAEELVEDGAQEVAPLTFPEFDICDLFPGFPGCEPPPCDISLFTGNGGLPCEPPPCDISLFTSETPAPCGSDVEVELVCSAAGPVLRITNYGDEKGEYEVVDKDENVVASGNLKPGKSDEVLVEGVGKFTVYAGDKGENLYEVFSGKSDKLCPKNLPTVEVICTDEGPVLVITNNSEKKSGYAVVDKNEDVVSEGKLKPGDSVEVNVSGVGKFTVYGGKSEEKSVEIFSGNSKKLCVEEPPAPPVAQPGTVSASCVNAKGTVTITNPNGFDVSFVLVAEGAQSANEESLPAGGSVTRDVSMMENFRVFTTDPNYPESSNLVFEGNGKKLCPPVVTVVKYVPPAPTATLAYTGSPLTGIAALAAVLLVVGMSVLVLRRRVGTVGR